MNILRLTTRILPDKGGPARYAYFLSKNVSSKNFKFFNISCQSEKSTNRKVKLISPNFKIYFLPIQVPEYEDNLLTKFLFVSKFLYFSLKKIFKIHKGYRIDLIHSDNPSITGIVAFMINKVLKIPFIYTQHGIESPYLLDYLFELNLIYPSVKKYLIISRKMISYFKLNKKETDKLEWIPNGVNISGYFHAQSKLEKKKLIEELNCSELVKPVDFIIIYVGYMNLKQKVLGMIDFFNAFRFFTSKLNDKESENVKLLYIGTGTYENMLKKQIKNYSPKNVYLLGEKLQIKKYYAIADLCGLTSYMEGFPTVLLEAIASQVPCIATDVGENNKILSKESLVNPGAVDEFTEKTYKFYSDKKFREKVIRISQNKIRKFDWEKVSMKLKSLYIECVYKPKV